MTNRELRPGPDFGNIKWIKPKDIRICFFGLHDLYICCPFDLLTILHSFPKFTLRVIRIYPTDPCSFIGRKLLLAMFGKEVILDVDELPSFVYPLESVTTISVIMFPSIWSTMITEKHHTCVIGFGGERQQIKKGVVIQEKVLWVPRLWPDHVGSLNRISAEKHRLWRNQKWCKQDSKDTYKVQADNIIVSFTSVKLDSKATRISRQVGKLATKSDRRKSHEDRSFHALATKEVCLFLDQQAFRKMVGNPYFGQVGNIGCCFKIPESSTSTRMNHPCPLSFIAIILASAFTYSRDSCSCWSAAVFGTKRYR